MLGIVNYGLGNVQAFANVYKNANIPYQVCSSAEELRTADHILLPGVGAFDEAMQLLSDSGMREALDDKVIGEQTPVLGVCVGMQIMGGASDEGSTSGLGWIDGVVQRIDCSKLRNKPALPHMGWNDVLPRQRGGLFEGLERDAVFYFLHSYCFVCSDDEAVLAETEYGDKLASSIKRDNIYGVQFHPEKSHSYGIRLLTNFAGL
jgi:glutamine amidotransferase